MTITEDRLTKALTYLATSDQECADAKSWVARTEYLAKLREAFAFKAAQGDTVRDREVAAKTDQDAQKCWEIHFEAIASYEKLRAKRELEALIVEVWRSVNANRRQGQI